MKTYPAGPAMFRTLQLPDEGATVSSGFEKFMDLDIPEERIYRAFCRRSPPAS